MGLVDYLHRLPIINTMNKKGYKLSKRDNELNIIGIRSKSKVINLYNDAIVALYYQSGIPKIEVFRATTDPGLHWLSNLLNPKGTAILKEGQYEDTYAIGLHQNKYKALKQVKSVTVFRDGDLDNELDFVGDDLGMFGINIHRSKKFGISKFVNKWSAGCQVVASSKGFNRLMELAEKSRSRYGNEFTYTLLHENDILKMDFKKSLAI